MTLKKATAFLFTLGTFFQLKALQAPFLPKFTLTFQESTTLKYDLQKKACALTFLVPILQNLNTYSDFAKVFFTHLAKFPPILH